MDYYNNYEITKYYWELTDIEKETLDIAIFIIDNKTTLVNTGKNFMLSKTGVYGRINKILKSLSPELYGLVHKQFKNNKSRYFPC